MCHGMACEYEDNHDGSCRYHGQYFPCTEWDEDESEGSGDCPEQGEKE